MVPHRSHQEGRGIRARGERRTGHPVGLRATVRLRELARLYRRIHGRGRHQYRLARQIRCLAEAFPRHRPGRVHAASARTAFGPVDVFILQRTSPARWTWQPIDAPYPVLTFTPAQFSPHAFTVFTNLPGNSCWPSGSRRETANRSRTCQVTGLTAFQRMEPCRKLPGSPRLSPARLNRPENPQRRALAALANFWGGLTRRWRRWSPGLSACRWPTSGPGSVPRTRSGCGWR